MLASGLVESTRRAVYLWRRLSLSHSICLCLPRQTTAGPAACLPATHAPQQQQQQNCPLPRPPPKKTPAYLSSLAAGASFTRSRNLGLSMALVNPGPHPNVLARSLPDR